MSASLRGGLTGAAIFIIIKCLLFVNGTHDKYYNLVILSNIACVLIAVVSGMWWARDKHGKIFSNGLDRMKAGMRSGAVYAIIVSVFVYLYYNNIDKEFVQKKVQERVRLAEKADFTVLQKQNPEKLQEKNRADFIDDERESAELWYSPFMICTLTLVGLMVVAMIYSIVVSLFFKYLFFKPKF